MVWDPRREGRARWGGVRLARAARSPDGRWLLADRVSQTGRGLELWDLATGALVERLSSRRRVQARRSRQIAAMSLATMLGRMLCNEDRI